MMPRRGSIEGVAHSLPHDNLWPRAGYWFQDARETPVDCDLAYLGVPAWRTSISNTGAHATPAAVREALFRYSTWSASHDVDLRELSAADFGDVRDPDGPEGEANVIARVAEIVQLSRLLVAVGGDNSLTYGTALGTYGGQLPTAGLVTLDAHYDLRDGESNGSPVRRLIAAGLAGKRVVQVGIADFANSAEYAARARDYGIHVVHRDVLNRRPIEDVMTEALDIAGAAGGPIHVDLDVDVCDRAVVPGCPAAMPGGISADELRRAAYVAGAAPAVRSLDIAEIDATSDAPDGRTVRLAALLILEAAAGLAAR